jgi:hypothetical protein
VSISQVTNKRESVMASPIKFAHIVLKTAQYRVMVDWWAEFLEGKVRFGNDFLSFISYDDEHHRIAIAGLPHLQEPDKKSWGLEHFAFTYDSLESLLEQYERMKSRGITPYLTIHHGMTISAYYADPDGNQVETQVDVMGMDEADAFMHGPLFAENPIGRLMNFDTLVDRMKSGESLDSMTDYLTAR